MKDKPAISGPAAEITPAPVRRIARYRVVWKDKETKKPRNLTSVDGVHAFGSICNLTTDDADAFNKDPDEKKVEFIGFKD